MLHRACGSKQHCVMCLASGQQLLLLPSPFWRWLGKGHCWWVSANHGPCDCSVRALPPCSRGLTPLGLDRLLVQNRIELGWGVGGMAIAPSLPGRQQTQSQLHQGCARWGGTCGKGVCPLLAVVLVLAGPGGSSLRGRDSTRGDPSAAASSTQKHVALCQPGCFKMFVFMVQGNVSF